VASAKLPSLGNAPLYFKAVSVSIPPGQKISVSAPHSILYQLSGSTEIADGEAKKITSGAGALIAGGTSTSLTAGNGEPSTLLYFLLVPKDVLDESVAAAPATVKDLYRTPASLPGLKPGSYELNLTRVTFPPGIAIAPAAPSLGRCALLHRLGHRREHGRRQDSRTRAGISDLPGPLLLRARLQTRNA